MGKIRRKKKKQAGLGHDSPLGGAGGAKLVAERKQAKFDGAHVPIDGRVTGRHTYVVDAAEPACRVDVRRLKAVTLQFGCPALKFGTSWTPSHHGLIGKRASVDDITFHRVTDHREQLLRQWSTAKFQMVDPGAGAARSFGRMHRTKRFVSQQFGGQSGIEVFWNRKLFGGIPAGWIQQGCHLIGSPDGLGRRGKNRRKISSPSAARAKIETQLPQPLLLTAEEEREWAKTKRHR